MKSLKKVEGINVVPLIDVMLVLLAIIMTISSFIALGKIEINLPKASSSVELKPKEFEIVITANKEFYFNNELINKDDLTNKIELIKKDDLIAISADKLTPYEEFIFVINLLKQKNIEKISMIVKK